MGKQTNKHRKLNAVKVMVLSLALALLTAGCWGARETDELGYVLALGIDKGKSNDLLITFQVAKLAGGGAGDEGGGGGSGEGATEFYSVEAASVFGALQLANAFISKEMTLIHNRAVIISEELAKEGLSEYINPFIRSREVRRSTFLFITPGQAADVMKNNKPVLEPNPSRQLELMMEAHGYSGFVPVTDIHEINIAMKSMGQEAVSAVIGVSQGKNRETEDRDLREMIREEVAYLPGQIPREGGNKIDIIGAAVFRGDELAGYLDGAQTRYYQMVRGSFGAAILTFPDPQNPEFSLEMEIIKGRRPAIQVKLGDGPPQIDLTVILEAEIIGLPSGIDYESGPKERELEQYLEQYITAEIRKLIAKTQKEYRSDIFGFGEHARKYFWTWQEWQDYNWPDKYPAARISVETKLAIRRTGLMSRTTGIPVDKKAGD